ncbi:hypothetical protein RN51_01657 [Microbacterium oxydans]|uniref:Uncharacterized protein n=1 Tax=Microbacterium oxydans TaxID=82380 RepID=A0A0F0KPS5_9MICO|nr:hypothetical protein [Microbacterium oxydans]KJL22912.1 hypothetical protein RN51_01657 [Microbacterium oxydans]
MTRVAHQPGKRLVPSNGGTGPRRWTGTSPAAAPVAIPSGPLWDAHGWQPNGTHRKTNTAVSPEGVPFAYSQTLREASPTITEADVTRLHSGSIPADYAAEGLRHGATVEEVEMLWAERWSKGGLHRRFGSAPPAEAQQTAPVAPRTSPAPVRRTTRASKLGAALDALRTLNIPRKEDTDDTENL